MKASGRGRLHYLLAGDEGLVAAARDALEDDGKGDSGAWRILIPIVSAKSMTVSSILHNTRDCPTITNEFRGGQNAKKLTKSGLPKALQAGRVFFIIENIFKYV